MDGIKPTSGCFVCRREYEATPKELWEKQYQFNCEDCVDFWWKWASGDEPTSKCSKCSVECEATPKEMWEGPLVCKFKCACSRKYTVICKRTDTADCHVCKVENEAISWQPLRHIKRKDGSSDTHSCSECNGRGNCPNLMTAAMKGLTLSGDV